MEMDAVDLYEDVRLINFWFWTQNGFMVQTAEYNIQSITTLTISDVKRSLSKEIYKPPTDFDGDPFLHFWRRHCLVYDGMILEDNATVSGVGIELREEDFLILKRVDFMKSGTWHHCHDEEKLKVQDLRKRKDDYEVVGFQKVLREPKQKRGFQIIQFYPESRNHTSEEAIDACNIQLLEIKEQLIKKLLVDFGMTVGETHEGLEIIKRVPPGFHKIVANFKNGEYEHSHDAIADIQQLLKNYYESINDKKHGKTEREVMEMVFERLCKAVDEYIERNNELFLRPTCITSYKYPNEPFIFVGPMRSQTSCQLPVFHLRGIGRFTIIQDLINSYKHYLRSIFEYGDCKIKKLDLLIYDNQAFTPDTLLYEIIETKRLRRFYFSFSGDVVVIKKDKRDINDLVQFIEGDAKNSGKKKKTKKKNKVNRKNSKLGIQGNEVSRSSVSIDKESSIRDTSPELDLDEIEVNHEVLRTDIINVELQNRVYNEIQEEKLTYENNNYDPEEELSSPDVSISVDESGVPDNPQDDDFDVPEITIDEIDDIDDDYTLNSTINIQSKKIDQRKQIEQPHAERINSMERLSSVIENASKIEQKQKNSEPTLEVPMDVDEQEVEIDDDDQEIDKMIQDLKEREKELTATLNSQRESTIGKSKSELKKEEPKDRKNKNKIKPIGDPKEDTTVNSQTEKDEDIENLEKLITDQEDALQKHKDYIESLIEAKGNEMKKIIVSITNAENEESATGKKINENDLKIMELKEENEQLREQGENQLKIIEKFDKKKHKLENFIDIEMDKFREEKNTIDEEIEKLRLEREEVIERKKQPPLKVFSDNSKIDKLMSFLDKSISAKERELECPLCLEVSSAPIFMCPESHLICSRCRPKVEKCPECRTKYKGAPKIHRYAEKAAEELLELKKEKKELFGTS